MIKIKNLNKSYRNERVLTSISLEVKKGEFIALIGPNGAGKTTLLKLIDGLISPDDGEIEVFGANPQKYGLDTRKNTGFIFQDEIISRRVPLSVSDIVNIGRTGMRGLIKRLNESDLKAAEKAMRELGIYNLKDRPAGTLSGGQKRKVAIARELARDIRIMLVDEILTNLDPAAQLEINRILCDIYEKYELTVILVTHLLQYLPEKVSRIIAMKDGKMFWDGNPQEIENGILSDLYGIKEERLEHYAGNFRL